MRIVMDVSHLSHPRTGVGNYTRSSLAGLADAAEGRHELVGFAAANARGGVGAIRRALAGIPVELRLLPVPFADTVRTAWSRLGRPAAERFLGRFDVLHFWDWMYPPQQAGVRATSVNDLVPLRFPEWTLPRTRQLHGAKYREVRRCDVVFCNSALTARDVVERLGVAEARVRIAPPGVDPVFRPDGERSNLGRPYALAVGSLEPRKNLGTLAAAHRLLDERELALAIAGPEGWGSQPGLDGAIRLGYVTDEELARLYRGAEVFVYPSWFEGFGIPVLEAMASGVPCVVSSHPSLDEASGDAAVRADPGSADAIATAIEEALARREELVRRGLEHARRFTWRKTGRTLLQGYEAVA
jgi:glycosyltransferase involved in cell wall biosynthesis